MAGSAVAKITHKCSSLRIICSRILYIHRKFVSELKARKFKRDSS